MTSSITLVSQLRMLAISFLLILCFSLLIYLLPEELLHIIEFPAIVTFSILLFWLPFRYGQYKRRVNFSYKCITIDDREYHWSEVKAYRIENTPYVEALTIRLHSNREFTLTGLTYGKKSKQFQNLKKRFLIIVNYNNKRSAQSDPIFEIGFFKTRIAKLLIIFLGIVAGAGGILLLLGEVKNPVPVIMLFGLLGIMSLQVFKK